MKFYRHDPDAFLAGTAELNFEQRGAYISLIDLLYSRDGIVPNDDGIVARMLQTDPRIWRRLKTELMAAAKVRITNDGRLTANRVDQERLHAEVRSTSARHSVNVRWENYRNAKTINGEAIQARNTPITKIDKKESSCPVNSGDNSDNSEPGSQTTASLKAAMRAKGWIT